MSLMVNTHTSLPLSALRSLLVLILVSVRTTLVLNMGRVKQCEKETSGTTSWFCISRADSTGPLQTPVHVFF